jgi:hypothetical protein
MESQINQRVIIAWKPLASERPAVKIRMRAGRKPRKQELPAAVDR